MYLETKKNDIFEMAGYIKGRNGDLLTKINPNPIFHGKTGRTNLLRIFQSEVFTDTSERRYWVVVPLILETTHIAYGLRRMTWRLY
jgi:hypothetical protein